MFSLIKVFYDTPSGLMFSTVIKTCLWDLSNKFSIFYKEVMDRIITSNIYFLSLDHQIALGLQLIRRVHNTKHLWLHSWQLTSNQGVAVNYYDGLRWYAAQKRPGNAKLDRYELNTTCFYLVPTIRISFVPLRAAFFSWYQTLLR